VNEADLIRRQLALEREHAREVIAAARAGLRSGTERSDSVARHRSFLVEYLRYLEATADALEARIEAHLARSTRANTAWPELRAARAASGARATAALGGTERTGTGSMDMSEIVDSINAYTENLMSYINLSESLEDTARAYDLSAWRTVAHLDADSIMAERRRHAAMLAAAREWT
jgi:hypothetical protein